MFIGAVRSIVEVIGIDGVAVEQLKTVLLVQFLENRLFDVVFGNEIGHWETAICAARWNLLYLFCPVVWALIAKFRIITFHDANARLLRWALLPYMLSLYIQWQYHR